VASAGRWPVALARGAPTRPVTRASAATASISEISKTAGSSEVSGPARSRGDFSSIAQRHQLSPAFRCMLIDSPPVALTPRPKWNAPSPCRPLPS
jgi:hypothetical protein